MCSLLLFFLVFVLCEYLIHYRDGLLIFILQVVMTPHEQAEAFVSSYRKLMQEDTDINNFQKILEMKVCGHP